ncbi:uncharacterized mitochondrial protein AtMg00810-like [Impatiens glandulifera]|uniref:uncharacterized mitochondrial protein AtMg00810-like n=1 Tax=Impatiens glandulifera TaxID=253017 RepID=UPI001FB1357A|nr:uncharacterized mitochondrial protein AtMg00810-like [Impatiens glandulifera]
MAIWSGIKNVVLRMVLAVVMVDSNHNLSAHLRLLLAAIPYLWGIALPPTWQLPPLVSLIRDVYSIHVLVYVNGLIIAGSSSTLISRFKDYLHSCFHMKDLEHLKYFLSIKVARGPNGIFLSQCKYVLDLLTKVGMLGCRPIDTPMEKNHYLTSSTTNIFGQPSQYWYLGDPAKVFVYDLHRLSLCDLDSDWASYPLTRRSLTGFVVFLGHSRISWRTKKKPIVVCSSTEAEYRDITVTT